MLKIGMQPKQGDMMAHRLSEELNLLVQQFDDQQLTIKEIADHFPSRIQALFIVFLCLPFIFLLPIPGLSFVFGIFILLNGLRVAAKRELYFPRFILKRKISGKTMRKALIMSGRVIKKIENLVKPRGAYLHRHPWLRRLNGFILAFCGFLMAIPLPPLTNFPPALTAALLALGLLEEDGVFIGAGYVCFCLTLLFYIFIPYLGFEEIFRRQPQ